MEWKCGTLNLGSVLSAEATAQSNLLLLLRSIDRRSCLLLLPHRRRRPLQTPESRLAVAASSSSSPSLEAFWNWTAGIGRDCFFTGRVEAGAGHHPLTHGLTL
ncbi:hypothetical protein QN277_018716 [Acacia crassicarpa]|uniref:Uncharacterized protein n=1 Tax=Acacia crassicarpa TaxID=499986 RepID=A0AAE1JSC2_9FABA|nr:hypothetical protein QN277_018716 [Acacia crassicarpa]